MGSGKAIFSKRRAAKKLVHFTESRYVRLLQPSWSALPSLKQARVPSRARRRISEQLEKTTTTQQSPNTFVASQDDRRGDYKPEREDCPPATAYMHKVLKTAFQNMAPRNLHGLQTWSEAIDRLATAAVGRAAGFVSLRFKAVEVALRDGLDVGTHLECLPNAKRLRPAETKRS